MSDKKSADLSDEDRQKEMMKWMGENKARFDAA